MVFKFKIMVHYYMAQYYKKDNILHFARKPEDFAKKDVKWQRREGGGRLYLEKK